MISEPSSTIDPHAHLASQVFDSLIAAIAVIDKEGTIRATNDAWLHFCDENGGTQEKTGVGVNYLQVCERAYGADAVLAAKASKGIQAVQAGKRDVFKLEYPCHSAEEERWFLLHVSPLKSNPEFAVAAHLPITDRKLIEQQLIETERLAAIGQAMQGLSHEGRNSLQRAQGCIDLLRFQIEGDNEANDLLDRIEIAHQRLVSLYEEVRSYAVPIELQRSPHRIDDLVAEVWRECAQCQAIGNLSHESGSTDFSCDVDPNAIRQLLRSVFANAIAAGGMPPQVNVGYHADTLDHRPAITTIITDNGTGIPEGLQQKMFEPFFTTKLSGTGLGLAICKRIAEAHGGRIWAENTQQGGAAIYLQIPVRTPLDDSRPSGATSSKI